MLQFLGKLALWLLKILFDPMTVIHPHRPLHRSRFMNFREKISLLNRKNRGVCINGQQQLSLQTSLTHVFVHGGTGSGKTSTVIIPTVLKTAQSCIIVDLDGSIYRHTAGWKQSQDFSVQVLNLARPQQSTQYNPVALCLGDSDRKNLAEILVRTAFPGTRGDSLFWNQGAVAILYVLLRFLQTQPRQFHNLANLLHLVNRFGNLKSIFAEKAPSEVWHDYQAIGHTDERISQAHLATARVALDKLNQPNIAQLTSQHTLDFAALAQPKNLFYLIVPEAKLNHYSFLLSLFFTQLFEWVQTHRPTEPILFLLDECAHYHIPNLPLLITTLRRYNCSLTLIVQDQKQLVSQYGEAEAAAIIDGGCRSHLYFPGMRIDVAERLARRIGQRTMLADWSQQYHQWQQRDLLTASEIIQLPRQKALFLHHNQPPLLTTMRPYFRSNQWKKRAKLNPPDFPKSTQTPVELYPISSPMNS